MKLRQLVPFSFTVAALFAGLFSILKSAAGEYMAGFTSMVRRDPIGVVASIAPWNYPLMMMAVRLSKKKCKFAKGK